VLRREWLALFKQYNAADDGFSSRPKGDSKMPQSCVTALDKGTTLAFALRLDL